MAGREHPHRVWLLVGLSRLVATNRLESAPSSSQSVCLLVCVKLVEIDTLAPSPPTPTGCCGQWAALTTVHSPEAPDTLVRNLEASIYLLDSVQRCPVHPLRRR